MVMSNAMNMDLGKIWEMVRDRSVGTLHLMGLQKSQTWLGNWTTYKWACQLPRSYQMIFFKCWLIWWGNSMASIFMYIFWLLWKLKYISRWLYAWFFLVRPSYSQFLTDGTFLWCVCPVFSDFIYYLKLCIKSSRFWKITDLN